MNRWTPKSVLALRAYSADTFRHDLLAGVTVGLVALPLATPQPAALMADSDFQRYVGPMNICANTSAALARAAEIHRASRHVA